MKLYSVTIAYRASVGGVCQYAIVVCPAETSEQAETAVRVAFADLDVDRQLGASVSQGGRS